MSSSRMRRVCSQFFFKSYTRSKDIEKYTFSRSVSGCHPISERIRPASMFPLRNFAAKAGAASDPILVSASVAGSKSQLCLSKTVTKSVTDRGSFISPSAPAAAWLTKLTSSSSSAINDSTACASLICPKAVTTAARTVGDLSFIAISSVSTTRASLIFPKAIAAALRT